MHYEKHCMKTTGWFVLAIAWLFLGCEEEVVGVLGTDQTYSMYGVLNPRADTQYIRVFPIEGLLVSGQPVPLDARFESLNLTTDERVAWRDSVVEDRGGYGHIFWAPFRAEYGESYRITIEGADQQRAGVEVVVPPLTEPELETPGGDFSVLLPIRFRGEIPRLIRTELAFYLQYTVATTATGAPVVRADTVNLGYDDRVSRTSTGLLLNVNLTEAAQIAREQVGGDPDFDVRFGINLLYITMDAIVANDAWNPPGGVFDPNVLVQPGVMSNVENGFGFVGAGYRVGLSWQPTNDVMERAGFAPFE
jgi:hypothetical protein